MVVGKPLRLGAATEDVGLAAFGGSLGGSAGESTGELPLEHAYAGIAIAVASKRTVVRRVTCMAVPRRQKLPNSDASSTVSCYVLCAKAEYRAIPDNPQRAGYCVYFNQSTFPDSHR